MASAREPLFAVTNRIPESAVETGACLSPGWQRDLCGVVLKFNLDRNAWESIGVP
jgi:hypothetical protein